MPTRIGMLLLLLAGSLFIGQTRVQQAPAAVEPPAAETLPAPEQGHPAPAFRLQAVDGNAVELAQLRGQVVLVNLWASWCPPCRAEMPAIQAAYERYAEQGFVVLAVNVREDPATVSDFLRRQNLSFPTLLDSDGAVSAIYRVRALPASFFVDRRGVIRAVYRGPLPHGVIAGTLEQLLAESEPD